MARATSVKQYNTFIKGLVTEASPLTYPENASLDEDNFVLQRNGSRERRLGVDYENGYALVPTGLVAPIISGSRQSFHLWENPGNDASVSIGVVRVSNRLWFVDLLTNAPSSNLLNAGNPIIIAGLANADIETSVINNTLVIVSADLPKPITLTYDTATGLVTQAVVDIKVRDLWGVWDLVGFIPADITSFIDWRRDTIDITHRYNLRNQGWSSKIQTTCGSDAIDCTQTELGVYPSNADIWTLGKIGVSTDANFEKYDPNVLLKNSIDNAEAPKGSYIIDAFYRGASRRLVSGLNVPFNDADDGSFTTVASYAGRVFYSGVPSYQLSPDERSPNYSNYIFFSQVVTAPDKIGKCYQEADPTSPNISDIVDTDGGTIQIPEATRIYRLIATQSSLLVFAENGIWEVFGDTNGFVATSYQTSKITSTGFSAPKSVVEAIGTIFAWTKAGIYVVAQDPASGRYKAENISLNTIQTRYNAIGEDAKNNARGFYDEKENRIRWLYNDTDTYTTSSDVNKYNRELVLDLTLQAFYPQTIATGVPYVTDYIALPNYTVTSIDEDIYAGNEPVIDATLAQVIVSNDTLSGRITPFSFLTMVGTSFTFSKYNSDSFLDWKTYDGIGVNYSSYLLTGYETFGDIIRTKQVPYIWFYFTKTEDGFTLDINGDLQIDHPSSCKVKAKWNWTDSAASGQWGTQFQAYKFNRYYIPSGESDVFNNGYEVIVTKNKLRGSGRSLSMLIESESGKDMRILGWSVIVSAGTTP
jgi:hypothetical protein